MKHFLLTIALCAFTAIGVQAQNGNLGFEKASSSIFPNPATNQITVKFSPSSKVENVVIYSIIGNEILNKKVDQSTNFKLNIQNLKKGKYIVRVFKQDGSTESLSLIKN